LRKQGTGHHVTSTYWCVRWKWYENSGKVKVPDWRKDRLGSVITRCHSSDVRELRLTRGR